MAEEREPSVLGQQPADAEGDGAAGEDAGGEVTETADAGDTVPAPAPVEARETGDARVDEADDGGRPAPGREPLKPARPLTKKSSAPTFYVAGFWRRLGAGLIDLAIILPVSYLLAWIAGTLAGVSLPESRHHGLDFWLDLFLASDPALIGGLGLTLAIAAIYALVFQMTTAATPGMRVLKTRIIDIYGDPPSTGRALARTGGYLACAATLALGFLWIGFDSEKRGLHDWISGTYVVKA